ncbi:hypothetical protein VP01_567g4 [Puccinia sorghi]|uniref:Uncharacterized protein n=1 Tax=Puccinia sorghi TaxID=27349 RepID=A0A0L6UKU3_9BASI|nr:hypothetical protein VP01_567g4 [Puccinia sorghi]
MVNIILVGQVSAERLDLVGGGPLLILKSEALLLQGISLRDLCYMMLFLGVSSCTRTFQSHIQQSTCVPGTCFKPGHLYLLLCHVSYPKHLLAFRTFHHNLPHPIFRPLQPIIPKILTLIVGSNLCSIPDILSYLHNCCPSALYILSCACTHLLKIPLPCAFGIVKQMEHHTGSHRAPISKPQRRFSTCISILYYFPIMHRACYILSYPPTLETGAVFHLCYNAKSTLKRKMYGYEELGYTTWMGTEEMVCMGILCQGHKRTWFGWKMDNVRETLLSTRITEVRTNYEGKYFIRVFNLLAEGNNHVRRKKEGRRKVTREAETPRVGHLALANQKTPLEVRTWPITGCYLDGSDSDQSEHRIQIKYYKNPSLFNIKVGDPPPTKSNLSTLTKHSLEFCLERLSGGSSTTTTITSIGRCQISAPRLLRPLLRTQPSQCVHTDPDESLSSEPTCLTSSATSIDLTPPTPWALSRSQSTASQRTCGTVLLSFSLIAFFSLISCSSVLFCELCGGFCLFLFLCDPLGISCFLVLSSYSLVCLCLMKYTLVVTQKYNRKFSSDLRATTKAYPLVVASIVIRVVDVDCRTQTCNPSVHARCLNPLIHWGSQDNHKEQQRFSLFCLGNCSPFFPLLHIHPIIGSRIPACGSLSFLKIKRGTQPLQDSLPLSSVCTAAQGLSNIWGVPNFEKFFKKKKLWVGVRHTISAFPQLSIYEINTSHLNFVFVPWSDLAA